MVIKNGVVTQYSGDPMIVRDYPPMPAVVAVKNNGEWFNPPKSHLDQPITTTHPVDLANKRLEFYKGFIAELENKFFSNDPNK